MSPEAAIGSRVPHVALTTRGGSVFTHADIWQRRQLLLVLMPPETSAPWADFADRLERVRQACRDMDTELVVSTEAVAGLEPPLALVADRWGEITHAAGIRIENDAVTPDIRTILTWVEATVHRCPECEGEAR